MSFRGITRYGGVRSPYLGRPTAKREYVVDYARLDGGLNLWDLDYRMGRNESPEMENLWWRDGVLCCRDGQNACDGVDEDGKKAGPGVGYAASNGQFHGMEFFHIGACIYYGDPSQEDMTLVKLCEGIPEVRGTFFQYDGALYYKTKGCFKKITNGETFEAADVAGYVPVIVLNADPATGSGDLYQPENRLADGKTVWYNAKEGVKEYHLPVQDVAAVTKVEVDGAEKTVETDYTVDLKKGTVTFTSAPPVTNPPTNNTVKITYTKENTAAKKAVMDCRYAIVYGGGNSVVLVLAGSEEQPNAYFWNGNHTVMDAAYFPISQYNLAGDRAEAVTGFGVQSGFLMIFKEHSVGRAELSTSEIDGRAYLTLNYTNVNSETGCDLPWTIKLVENNLVFCNREQGVHIVKSTTPALENNIESISRNVNGTAERRGLLYDVRKAGDVCACDDGDRYWLAANGHVYVWDYVLSSASKPSWFYFTNIRAAAFFLADETVHHLSSSGRVTRMERTYADYNGPIDKVYRFATQHFGSYDRLKDVRRVVFQTRSDTDTAIRITYKSDYETRRELTDIESFSWRLCPRDLTHRYLGVPQFALAAVRKPGCRHVRHFTMTLENHEAFRDMSLVGAQIYYNYQEGQMMGYLEKLEFSKDWTDAEGFPTYEPDESQVRADLQLLHNEAKAAINALVDKLESAEFASHLAVSAEGMTATNLAAALAEILATAKAAQAGTIVDGTVTEAKLAAALVQKINSIDVTYSMNAPTANETPETGYQLGKLWLKPEFSIANLASDYALASGADWTGENVTKEASGGKLVFSGTGDSQYGTAKAEFTVPAGHTVRVWLTAEETAGQFASLKAYLGTTEYTLTSGTQLVQDVTAGEDGKVAIQVKADWSNTVTAAGGKFTITAFTAVDKAASMLPGCTALTDGNLDALVAAKAPFAEAKTRRELYGQQTAGVWKRLVPDEDQTSDELTVTDPVAGLAGVQTGATLSEVLVAMRNSIGRIEDAINGAPGGYVWNKYAYEQKETSAVISTGESDISYPPSGYFLFTVANSVAMNPTTGEITLVNPTEDGRHPTAGEYFTCKIWKYWNGDFSYQNVSGVYHWNADTQIVREQTGYANGKGIYELILRGGTKVIGSLEFQGIVTSQAQDAYPADGWVENVKYVSAPKSQLSSVGKCATGSYVGTGLYGASSPNSLEFTFVPKTVEILGYSYEYEGKTRFKLAYQNSYSYPLLIGERIGTEYAEGTGFYDGAGYSDTYSNPGYAKKSADGKTIFWYSGGANTQFNNSGYTYYYRALG